MVKENFLVDSEMRSVSLGSSSAAFRNLYYLTFTKLQTAVKGIRVTGELQTIFSAPNGTEFHVCALASQQYGLLQSYMVNVKQHSLEVLVTVLTTYSLPTESLT
jgi:hypothetical protein